MKKLIIPMAIVLCAALVGCNTTDNTASKKDTSSAGSTGSSVISSKDSTKDETTLRDGKYTEEAESYDQDGYKKFVTLTVEDGKIKKIDCNGKNKKGEYKKDDKTFADFVEQIGMFEDAVMTKGIENITIDTSGKVADIKGLNLNVSGYGELIKKAVKKAEVE